MKKWPKGKILVILSLLLITSVFSQLDLKEKAKFKGLVPKLKVGKNNFERVGAIGFIFVDKPSSFFHQKDLVNKTLTIDIYDSEIESDTLITLSNIFPFSSFTVIDTTINRNEGIEDLAADSVKLVRARLNFSEDDINYTMTQDYNVLVLKYGYVTAEGKAAGHKMEALSQEKTNVPYKIIFGAVGASALTALIMYLISGDDSTGTEPPPDPAAWNPTPPTLPTL